MSYPLCPASVVLAVDGLVGSGYFLLALGLLCAGLGLYFRQQGGEARPAAQTPKKGKGKKKGQKSRKNKQQDSASAKDQVEGGSLIWGGLGFALIGIGMVLFGFFR